MLNNTLFICNGIKQKYYVSDIFDRKSKTRIEVHIMKNSHTVALLFHVQESIGGSQKLFYQRSELLLRYDRNTMDDRRYSFYRRLTSWWDQN